MISIAPDFCSYVALKGVQMHLISFNVCPSSAHLNRMVKYGEQIVWMWLSWITSSKLLQETSKYLAN
jgi:hypothetical protein